MKIALICPSNMLYMPYVGNYEIILNENNIQYDIINWDRFGIEKESEFTYIDSKIGHRRNIFDYLKYSRFVLNILKDRNYDKVIVFGIQLVFFLKRYLTRKYCNRYIIDIRDHNRIIKYFDIKKAIHNSTCTVLSSPGYKEWLPKSNKYVINHNTQIESLDELKKVSLDSPSGNKLLIGCIGALSNYQINIDLIKSLKNNKSIHLNYHGEGVINKDISLYLNENDIKNVKLTGRYAKEQEVDLYNKNNIINVLINGGINNKTCLPNRLYNAAIYGKPMLAFEGTYLAEIVKKYNLGLVVGTFDNIERQIMEYINNFNFELYEKGRILFLNAVIKENEEFSIIIKEFIS